jgi:SAM-dependent methyltransferase
MSDREGRSVLPKPDHLGPEYAAQFADPSVVAAYRHRPPYPSEVFDILLSLIADEPRAVLDVGTGAGELARGLVGRVARVDAVDPAPGMIATGRALPGGDHPGLRWIEGRAEDAPLDPPYALVTAGQSLHWMDWAVVLPRLRDALTPRGVLAIVGQREGPYPWDAEVLKVIQRSSTNTRYRPYDLIAELETRRLFEVVGRTLTEPVAYTRTVSEYVESFHARNGLSRDRLDPAVAAAFDREVTALVAPHADGGVLRLNVAGNIVWGRPAPH